MPNPFNAVGNNVMMNNPMNNMNRMVQQFNQFRSTFQGNPREKVQELLNNGTINQGQLNQFQQMAKQYQQFFMK